MGVPAGGAGAAEVASPADDERAARTKFSPPPASMERLAVRDRDGRTMFDVYEPRYHASPAPERARGAREEPPPPATLLEVLERRPVATLVVLFAVVLATSATVTAVVQR